MSGYIQGSFYLVGGDVKHWWIFSFHKMWRIPWLDGHWYLLKAGYAPWHLVKRLTLKGYEQRRELRWRGVEVLLHAPNLGPRLRRVAGLHSNSFIRVNNPLYLSDRRRTGSEIIWPFTEKRNPLLLRIEPKFRGRPLWIINCRENSEIMDTCKKRCRITAQTQLYLEYKTATCLIYINSNNKL